MCAYIYYLANRFRVISSPHDEYQIWRLYRAGDGIHATANKCLGLCRQDENEDKAYDVTASADKVE